MAEESTESYHQKVKEHESQEMDECRRNFRDLASAETEAKGEGSDLETCSDKRSESPSQISETPSTSGRECEPTPESSSGDQAVLKEKAFATWGSSEGTQEPTHCSTSPERSPRKEARTVTVASRGVVRSIGRMFGQIPTKTRKLLKGVLSKKEEKVSLVSQDDASSASSEQSSAKEMQESPSLSQQRDPLYAVQTGQAGGFVRGRITIENRLVDETPTDSTSLSGSISLAGDGDTKGSTVSTWQSTGDASSLERESEEFSSSSQGVQGQKRVKDPNDSLDSEEEEKAILGLCESSKKRMLSEEDADNLEEETKMSEM